MHWRFFPHPWILALLLPLACKEPEAAAVQSRAQQANSALAEARAFLARGQPGPALGALRRASSAAPESVEPLLLMADAHRMSGNPGAAILALKQARTLVPGNDPGLQRQIAELYLSDGHTGEAIAILAGLREADTLPDADVLWLARLQAREGDFKAAFDTLTAILERDVEDPEAKAVEAEVLLLQGEELKAAGLMDRLLQKNPEQTSARLLRARYFLTNGFPEMAEGDLNAIQGADAARADVVTWKARALLALGRAPEAEAALKVLVQAEPQNAEALAFLAETVLAQGRRTDAQALVDQALQLRPRLARALYVRGRVLEDTKDRRGAEESYGFAVKADPRFAPALSKMWRVHMDADRLPEAQETLERLLATGEASLDEKAALAGLYARFQMQVTRGLKLIDEALKRDPENEEYLRIKKSLQGLLPKPKKRPSGPVIIRGGR